MYTPHALMQQSCVLRLQGVCACKGGGQTARKARLDVPTLVNAMQGYQCVTRGTVTQAHFLSTVPGLRVGTCDLEGCCEHTSIP
jgi:hypothetical protein